MPPRSWLRNMFAPGPVSSSPKAAPVPQPTAPLPPSPPPAAGPRPPDYDLVRRHWEMHRRHHPGLTWRQFLTILEERHTFFAEERRDRDAKLARLNTRDRFTP